MDFPELNMEAFQEATSWRLRASFPREGAPWRNQVGPERSMISQAKGPESPNGGDCRSSAFGGPLPRLG